MTLQKLDESALLCTAVSRCHRPSPSMERTSTSDRKGIQVGTSLHGNRPAVIDLYYRDGFLRALRTFGYMRQVGIRRALSRLFDGSSNQSVQQLQAEVFS